MTDVTSTQSPDAASGEVIREALDFAVTLTHEVAWDMTVNMVMRDECRAMIPKLEQAYALASAPTLAAEAVRDREDAERWRAFASSARFRCIGSANFDHDAYPAVSVRPNIDPKDWLHFAIEVWDRNTDGTDEQGVHGRNLLMAYVEHRRATLAPHPVPDHTELLADLDTLAQGVGKVAGTDDVRQVIEEAARIIRGTWVAPTGEAGT